MSDKVPASLSDDDVRRLLMAIASIPNTNTVASMVKLALAKEPSFEGKRRLLTLSFAQAFELLTYMNMALQSTTPPAEIAARLQKQKTIGDSTQ